jgi:arylsulfatase A-like enzyme
MRLQLNVMKKDILKNTSVALLSIATLAGGIPAVAAPARPNIVLILADDMGYSDIGCYGGEIPTPNLDKLAAEGLRFTQFYNTSRCCPTRASLLTGLFQHQAGIGWMTEAPEGMKAGPNAPPGYEMHLNHHCVTLAEALRPAGYHTYMVGKWHVGLLRKEEWPLQRGFERYYGILAGATSYLQPHPPRGLTLDNTPLPPPEPPYYTTDAFTDYAIKFLKEQGDDNPFFLYVAYNSPHWPLQAKESDIKPFIGKYDMGWDKLRDQRWAQELRLGVVEKEWGLSPRDPGARPWDDLTDQQKKELSYRMAVYAAQVHCMDTDIGRLIAALTSLGKFDNTLILFLSDNGACSEPWTDLGGGKFSNINNPRIMGPVSYGQGWANASNTPFRRFKSDSYEGGISTPLIVHWPDVIKKEAGEMTSAPGYLIDIMPTLLEVAGATYPTERSGEWIYPLEGKSLVSVFETGTRVPAKFMYWEHQNEGAIRHGDWKAVFLEHTNNWELYNLAHDRTEQHDLAATHPHILDVLKQTWYDWAVTHQVYPKGRTTY